MFETATVTTSAETTTSANASTTIDAATATTTTATSADGGVATTTAAATSTVLTVCALAVCMPAVIDDTALRCPTRYSRSAARGATASSAGWPPNDIAATMRATGAPVSSVAHLAAEP